MPRHVEAWMDGVALSSVGPILIQQVYEDAPTLELLTGERPGRPGQIMMSRKRQSLKVTIVAAIRELRNLAYRAEVMTRLASWAQGSILELSNHPGKRLRVVCTAEPTLGAVRDYTAETRVELTAYEVPYWEDAQPTTLTIRGKSGEGSLIVPGTVEAPVNLTITPTGGTLTRLTVKAGERKITLEGLAVAAGGILVLDQDTREYMSITADGVGQLQCRTADSDDDLTVRPGRVTVICEADADCSVSWWTRGRWA